MTDAYSDGEKEEIAYGWSYKWKKPEEVSSSIRGRVRRIIGRGKYGGTSINISQARVSDSGKWVCELIFMYPPHGMNARSLARYRVKVIGKCTRLLITRSEIFRWLTFLMKFTYLTLLLSHLDFKLIMDTSSAE